MAETKKRSRLSRADRIRLILGGLLVLVFLGGSVGVWLFRDTPLRQALRLSPSEGERTGSYSYEPAARQSFAALGQSLVVARPSGFELLGADGSLRAEKICALTEPVVSAGENYAAVYDLGGTSLYWLHADGSIREQIFSGAVLFAEVSDSGCCVVIHREPGYHGLVSVWNEEQQEIYRWYCASAWPMAAALAPDGKQLAVLCVSAAGSEIKFFRLDSEQQQAAFSVSDTVLLDLHWFSSEALCAFSSERALFFSADGLWTGTYDFAGQHLVGFADGGDGFVSFALSPYRSGSSARLVTLDEKGRLLGETDWDGELLCMEAAGSEILVLGAGRAALFSPRLAETGRAGDLAGFRQAILRDKSEALLLAAGFAEVYSF